MPEGEAQGRQTYYWWYPWLSLQADFRGEGGKRGIVCRAADHPVEIRIHFIADLIRSPQGDGRDEDTLPERDMAVASPIRSRRYLSYAGSVLV